VISFNIKDNRSLMRKEVMMCLTVVLIRELSELEDSWYSTT